MVEKIVAVVLGIIFILFLLSVIAPMQSKRKFWQVIHKIRAGMDVAVYWLFNIYAILTVIYVIWRLIHGWI